MKDLKKYHKTGGFFRVHAQLFHQVSFGTNWRYGPSAKVITYNSTLFHFTVRLQIQILTE